MADSLFPLKSKGLVLFGHAYNPPPRCLSLNLLSPNALFHLLTHSTLPLLKTCIKKYKQCEASFSCRRFYVSLATTSPSPLQTVSKTFSIRTHAYIIYILTLVSHVSYIYLLRGEGKKPMTIVASMLDFDVFKLLALFLVFRLV